MYGPMPRDGKPPPLAIDRDTAAPSVECKLSVDVGCYVGNRQTDRRRRLTL